MLAEYCVLTTKDLTILEVMLDRCLGRDDPLVPILRRKIQSAIVVLSEDIPANVATLNSRVAYTVDGHGRELRVLARASSSSTVGLFLPIAGVRGLALLGLTEGGTFEVAQRGGRTEKIVLEKIHYQPEAAKREGMAALRKTPQTSRRPVLTLVKSDLDIRPAGQARPWLAPVEPDGFDDPGPSAA